LELEVMFGGVEEEVVEGGTQAFLPPTSGGIERN
jgi:hypothetical protein